MAIDFTPDTIDFTPDATPGVDFAPDQPAVNLPERFAPDISPFTTLRAQSYKTENIRDDVKSELGDARSIQRLLEQTLPPEQARLSANTLASSRFDELVEQVKRPTGVKLPPEVQLKQDYRTIFQSKDSGVQKEQATKKRTQQFLLERMDEIAEVIQAPYEQQKWERHQQSLKGKFLGKNYLRWERGEVMVVGGALHLAEEIQRLTTGGKYGDSAAESARLYHNALKLPEMRPVIEGVFDKYFGGAIETAPFMLAAMPVAIATGGATIPSAIGSFLVSYAVEGNTAYQTALDRGSSEKEARIRGAITGLINGGIEIAGGGSGKYFKNKAIIKATTKMGRAKSFSKRFLRNALKEGFAEELPQELVHMIAGGDVPRLKDGSVDWNQAVDRLIDAAVTGTIIGGLVDAPISIMGAAKTGKSITPGYEVAVAGSVEESIDYGTEVPAVKVPVIKEVKGEEPDYYTTKSGQTIENITSLPDYENITLAKLKQLNPETMVSVKLLQGRGRGGAGRQNIRVKNILIPKPLITATVEGKVEKIRAAAFYNPKTGEISEGENHGLAAAKMKSFNEPVEGKPGYVQTAAIEGFVTESGRFVTNKEAEVIAKASEQLPKGYKLTQEERLLGRPTAQNILSTPTVKASAAVEGKVEKLVEEKRPGKPTRAQFRLGHSIPKKLKMTEVERRAFMEKTIGKTTMKGLTYDEAEAYVNSLRQLATEKGIKLPARRRGGDESIVVAGEGTTMNKVATESLKVAVALPSKVKIPEHVRRRFYRKIRGTGLAKRLGRLFYGIDNSNLQELANVLEQGKPGMLTKVFSDNAAMGQSVESGHKRIASSMLMGMLEKEGITRKDLAKASESANPRTFQGLLESIGKGTTIHAVKIGGHTYDMTPMEMAEFYLYARQEDGLAYLKESGISINGVDTGPLADNELADILETVTKDKTVMATIHAFTKVGEFWKETLDQTSQRMEKIDIAPILNWWGLEPISGRQVSGKIEKVKRGLLKAISGEGQRFKINLIEDRRILNKRKGRGGPLVIRDALQRFSMFENAIAEYVGMAEPARVMRTVLNNPEFTQMLRNKGYIDVHKNMSTILQRAQSAPVEQSSFAELAGLAIPGIYRAVLFANPRVIASQFTSVTNYRAFTSEKYAILINKGFSPQAIKDTLEMSDIAWERFYMSHSSAALGEMASSDAALALATNTTSDKNKFGISLKATDLAALAVGMEIAKAEYTDAQMGTISGESARYWKDKNVSFKDGAGKPLNEASQDWKRAVTQRAEWLWRRSQPSWDKWNRSVITSDPGLGHKLFFLFRSFHEKSLTILHGAYTDYEGSKKTPKDKALFAKKYGAVLSGYALNTAMRCVIMAGLTKRIKDPFDYLKDIITAPFAMLPVLGVMLDGTARSFLNALTGHRHEFRGNAIESLPLDVINKTLSAPPNFAAGVGYYLNGEKQKAWNSFSRALGQTYEGVGLTVGIPVYETKRMYKGWIAPVEKKKNTNIWGK